VSEARSIAENKIVDIIKNCALVLESKKGLDIVIMDLRDVNSYLDYFLIATGNSRIHCRSMAREAEKFIHGRGMSSRSRPDYESGWIILDFNELIVHIFTQEMREYYQLEKLWGDAKRIQYQ
jgi:ribosome-associated protein